jgi:hypothetical protein
VRSVSAVCEVVPVEIVDDWMWIATSDTIANARPLAQSFGNHSSRSIMISALLAGPGVGFCSW